MVGFGLLLSTALASAPSPAPSPSPAAPAAAAPHDEARFSLSVGARAGGRFLGSSGGPPAIAGSSFGGGISLGLGVRVWRGLYVEASLAEGVFQNPEPVASLTGTPEFRHFGAHPSPESATTSETEAGAGAGTTGPGPASAGLLVGQILLGVRYEIRTPRTLRLRPSVFAGLTHLHEATLRDFVGAPGKTLAGVSKSIRHRSGAQLGVGLRIPFSLDPGRVASRFSGRIDADAAYYFDSALGRLQAGLGLGLQVVF